MNTSSADSSFNLSFTPDHLSTREHVSAAPAADNHLSYGLDVTSSELPSHSDYAPYAGRLFTTDDRRMEADNAGHVNHHNQSQYRLTHTVNSKLANTRLHPQSHDRTVLGETRSSNVTATALSADDTFSSRFSDQDFQTSKWNKFDNSKRAAVQCDTYHNTQQSYAAHTDQLENSTVNVDDDWKTRGVDHLVAVSPVTTLVQLNSDSEEISSPAVIGRDQSPWQPIADVTVDDDCYVTSLASALKVL